MAMMHSSRMRAMILWRIDAAFCCSPYATRAGAVFIVWSKSGLAKSAEMSQILRVFTLHPKTLQAPRVRSVSDRIVGLAM